MALGLGNQCQVCQIVDLGVKSSGLGIQDEDGEVKGSGFRVQDLRFTV